MGMFAVSKLKEKVSQLLTNDFIHRRFTKFMLFSAATMLIKFSLFSALQAFREYSLHK